MTALIAAYGPPLAFFAAVCLFTYLLFLAADAEHRASLARKTRSLRAALVRWVRGPFASPSREHPASRALSVRGWSTLTERDAREFEGLERQYWDVPAVADSDRLTPRGDL